jgi:hypothetical protein
LTKLPPLLSVFGSIHSASSGGIDGKIDIVTGSGDGSNSTTIFTVLLVPELKANQGNTAGDSNIDANTPSGVDSKIGIASNGRIDTNGGIGRSRDSDIIIGIHNTGSNLARIGCKRVIIRTFHPTLVIAPLNMRRIEQNEFLIDTEA